MCRRCQERRQHRPVTHEGQSQPRLATNLGGHPQVGVAGASEHLLHIAQPVSVTVAVEDQRSAQAVKFIGVGKARVGAAQGV